MKRLLLLVCFVFIFFVQAEASIVYFSLGANPKRFIPFLAVDSSSGEISSYIFNGLLKLDKNMKIVGDLAKSYEFEDGGKKIIFHLRKNVYWQDRVKFSVKDVIFTYKLITDPKTPTPYAGKYKLIKKIYAPDNYTVVVEYPYPFKPALYSWMMGIVPEHLLKNSKSIATDEFNRKPIGTGPYKLIEWKNAQYLKLEAFDGYFIHKPNIDTVIYKIIPDSTTALLVLKNGKLDMLSLTPLQYKYEFKGKYRNRYRIYFEPSSGYTFLGFNLKLKMFSDVRVRKAICMAIDRQQIKKTILFGFGKVADSIYPVNSPFFSDKTVCRYNPEGATKLLESLGYRMAKDGFLYKNGHKFEFTLYTNQGNTQRKYAAIMIQQYLRKIGIDMKIRIMEWQAFLNMVNERHFDAIILGWQLGADPDQYSLWDSKSDFKGGFNFVGFHDKRVDKLIEKARVTFDKAKSRKLYSKINDLIVHQYPYIFLYYPTSIVAINRKIKGIKPTNAGIMYNFIDWRY
ncbi:peptide-binding protein [Hippea maritima]|uniref:ABC-type transporter, periplasmic subunit n=1 Tax=Hippea maritima (strain ATCC 700847 / DSM 10411 / MH2) TaxID=760142 RepID=F2LX82_HIPMA|nr:peptide-binding protein [Hippea maritima]AEA33140.1 ABC-type transporter, periplasmic subunit [Hippea maritima DSM 10411]